MCQSELQKNVEPPQYKFSRARSAARSSFTPRFPQIGHCLSKSTSNSFYFAFLFHFIQINPKESRKVNKRGTGKWTWKWAESAICTRQLALFLVEITMSLASRVLHWNSPILSLCQSYKREKNTRVLGEERQHCERARRTFVRSPSTASHLIILFIHTALEPYLPWPSNNSVVAHFACIGECKGRRWTCHQVFNGKVNRNSRVWNKLA